MVLGPLFSLFIVNVLPIELSNYGLLNQSGINLFADDIKLHRVVNS